MEMSYQHFLRDSDDSEDAHQERVNFHVPTTSRVTRWSHIEDLDLFFARLYAYHQRHGFICILLGGCLELVKVIFMTVFCVFLLYFVDYEVLFHNKLTANSSNPLQKVTIPDVICSWNECSSQISGLTWISIAIVLVYWFFRLIKLAYNLYHFWDIKAFFNIALQIPDSILTNFTWQEVQKKICGVQVEYQMCIRKNELTELDIYHRILRSKNYIVAMINKSVLPVHHNLPFIGNICYMSQGLKYNIELLLFSGTWGFFDNWHLKEDYKKANKRQELATKLQTNILWFAIGNLILGVFIFVWQLVYFFFNYAELLKREPGVLALRCWSLYGRLYLRHFNELDHELETRLKRAYRPASKYMNTFSSPIMIIISQHIMFIAGSVFIVLAALAVYDEDVLTVEHVLTIMTILGAIIAIFKGFIPDENMCWCPETLMIDVLAEVHYLPDSWRGQAHTTFVRDQLAQFFQYKAVYLLFELVSPVVTPLIFYFKLKPRSLEIVDFYRNFTVAVLGVGDVCSFSLMDMRKHGNPAWQAPGHLRCPENNKQTQAEDGKTELSLIHFATMNPTWHPPDDAEQFLHEVKEKTRYQEKEDDSDGRHSAALRASNAAANMMMLAQPVHQTRTSTSKSVYRRGSRLDGPVVSSSYYFNPTFGNTESVYDGTVDCETLLSTSVDSPTTDMSISTLYLHSLHHKKVGSQVESTDDGGKFSINSYTTPVPISSRVYSVSECASEGTPLLRNTVKPA